MALQLSTYPLLFQVTTSLKKVERRGEIFYVIGFEGLVWTGLELSLVQILVVVAIIKVRNFKADARQGFERTVLVLEWGDPNLEDENLETAFWRIGRPSGVFQDGSENDSMPRHQRKGNRLTFLSKET